VHARAGRRAATSDWMEMEQKRGISITSTALSFEYRGHQMNLLDTPGHRDFSEDTYRVLPAVAANRARRPPTSEVASTNAMSSPGSRMTPKTMTKNNQR